MKPSEIIAEYRALREKKTDINRKADAAVAKIDERMDKLEAAMLNKVLVPNKMRSINGESGRCHIEEEVKVRCVDAQAFRDWVREHPSVGPDCMEARPVKKNLLPLIQESKDGHIAGIEVKIRDRVRFAKPTTK